MSRIRVSSRFRTKKSSDSVNLDLQSNTWHNLTYAYQGEGGSRVTYLDGRKVAEDQAEDTFGDYPPFAMTGYSQGGYVVSESSDVVSSSHGWKVFDDINDSTNDNYWNPNHASTDHRYGGTDGIYAGINSFQANSDSTPVGGEWLKVEFPYKLKLNYLVVQGRHGYTGAPGSSNQNPTGFRIIGSNDDVNWYILKTVTNQTGSQDPGTNNIIDTSHPAYKYYVFHVTHNAGSIAMSVGNLQFYGHRENDLVRLPDPTNVLKYPHIAMTGPAQRGYVVSASHQYATSGDGAAYNVFNTKENTWWGGYEVGNAARYTSPNFTYTGGGDSVSLGDTGISGEYIVLKLPYKITLSSLKLIVDDNINYAILHYTIVGSNNGTNWFTIKDVSGLTTSDYTASDPHTTTTDIVSSTAYSQIGLIVRQTSAATQTAIEQIQYFGTEENSSIPIQIGGGNIDKVANFRVYDKFVGEDQALEIWDAQKDVFGEVKNSMTLQKGRLGIGTTEPEGRLAVLDEPHNLEEFPPRAMTGHKNYFEGHGEFCVSASVDYGSNNYRSWNAFDKLNTSWNGGWTTHNYTWDTNGSLLPDTSNVVTFDGVQCHWVALELPYAVKPDHVTLLPRVDGSVPTEVPGKGRIYGSKDGVTWDQIRTYNIRGEVSTLNTLMGNTPISIPLTTINYYKHLLLTVEERFGGSVGSPSWTSIGQLRYFGTREQGQSVLHDGQLTLTKSLTVPRIGPALDADDTPRRDRLVVEYNTSTNPTFEGAVRDTGGRGNDGVFYGGASYDATEKALAFDGSTDYIMGSLGNAGDFDFTVSLWLRKNTSGTVGLLWNFGGSGGTGNPEDSVALEVGSNNNLDYFIFSGAQGAISNFGTTYLNRWVHIVATRSGNDLKIYLDGVDQNMSTTGTDTLQLAQNSEFTIGARGTGALGDNSLNGSISNFKIYDLALTAEEVKTLYDMGRCDEGHHVVNFSKTRVGIGLGDGEAPRGALDVRGDIYGGMPVFFDVRFTSSPTATYAGNRIVWDTNNDSRGGGFDTATGTFTAPIGGVYKFSYWARGNQANQGIKMKPRINGSPTFNTTNDGTDQNLRGTAFMGNDGISGSAWTIVPLEAGGTFDLFACSHGTTVTSSLATFYNGFTGEYISSL
jgi:hypothetical protein